MGYAELTRSDRNPIKRRLQRRRVSDALSLVGSIAGPENIVDFGAGDGELCRRLAARYPRARIYCYEPAPPLREEATELLKGIGNVVVVSSVDQLPERRGDLVFCMEVFEHLPAAQTREAIEVIDRVLADDGIGIIGVPLEVFAPALLKGVFRIARRYGQFDANPVNVARAVLGIPPQNRPVGEVAPGLPYHFHHLGFDHRRLREQLQRAFLVLRTVGSPLKPLGAWLNSEIYYVVRKAERLRRDA